MRTTVSLPDELAAYVDEHFVSEDASDAQAIRDAIQHARKLEDSVDDLQSQIDEREAQIDELESEVDRLQARLDEQEQRERERDQLEERVDELAIEVREQKNRAPWPLGWVGDIRDYLGEDVDESD